MTTFQSMRGKQCLCGEKLKRPTPNICQHETGDCLACQIYLDWLRQVKKEIDQFIEEIEKRLKMREFFGKE